MSGFKVFLQEPDTPKGKTRTVNIKGSTHDFYRKTANFYDINITTLVNNVLEDWVKRYKEEIRDDMIEKL
jgi:hypothetical protein